MARSNTFLRVARYADLNPRQVAVVKRALIGEGASGSVEVLRRDGDRAAFRIHGYLHRNGSTGGESVIASVTRRDIVGATRKVVQGGRIRSPAERGVGEVLVRGSRF